MMAEAKPDKSGRNDSKSDLEVLEELQEMMLEELREKGISPKVADLLKTLELKMKLRVPEKDKEKIWELINQLRKEELSSRENAQKESRS